MTFRALILSGSYVDSELQAEFGRIPPSFLPVQNTRLFQHQVSVLAGNFDEIWMTIPNDFLVNQFDQNWLDRHGVKVLPLDATLTLRQSLIEALEAICGSTDSIALNHGDTLVRDFPDLNFSDSVSVNTTRHYYRWARTSLNDFGVVTEILDDSLEDRDEDEVLSGFFAFSNVGDLLDCLQVNDTFIASVGAYSRKNQSAQLDQKNGLTLVMFKVISLREGG